ncbi:MAG: hypothetical protein IKZ53_04910 [Selenomonadaceae bacterium]|nr:hypothetical protein [Selenomonadaceae bacterium]
MLKCLNGADNSCDLSKLLERVKDDLNEHVGTAAQSYDITCLLSNLICSDCIKKYLPHVKFSCGKICCGRGAIVPNV